MLTCLPIHNYHPLFPIGSPFEGVVIPELLVQYTLFCNIYIHSLTPVTMYSSNLITISLEVSYHLLPSYFTPMPLHKITILPMVLSRGTKSLTAES